MLWESSASLTSPDAARIEIALKSKESVRLLQWCNMHAHTCRCSHGIFDVSLVLLEPCTVGVEGELCWYQVINCLLHHLSISDLFAAHFQSRRATWHSQSVPCFVGQSRNRKAILRLTCPTCRQKVFGRDEIWYNYIQLLRIIEMICDIYFADWTNLRCRCNMQHQQYW